MTARKHLGRQAKVSPLCRAIRSAREVAKLSQQELAAGLGGGVSQSMVARWESTSEPALSVVARIEVVLRLPRGDLLRAAGFVSDVVSVGRAIEEDPRLDDRARRVLLASYRQLVAARNGKL
jgi:transcriptional regulator with XRE-family HTH domain